FSDEHPQCRTHVVKLRDYGHVPVLAGPVIPRRELGERSEDIFSRAMLILFKPWRSVDDLALPGLSWKQRFEGHCFPQHLANIIANINVENECRDARNDHSESRRLG
ncbi:hypothetical protein OF83DRAFT_1032680, partial [Amylostereum chailletii]